MYLFNNTIHVYDSIASDFIHFISVENITVACSGCGFVQPLLTKVMAAQDAGTGEPSTSYALQMRAPSRRILDDFMTGTCPELLRLISDRWGMRVLFFSSVLEIMK